MKGRKTGHKYAKRTIMMRFKDKSFYSSRPILITTIIYKITHAELLHLMKFYFQFRFHYSSTRF